MKVVTIGRASNNDRIVGKDPYDPYIGRHHCQIIQDGNGNFRIVDLNTKNGTYVNGNAIKGEVALCEYDIVCIGQTTLPWRNYFNSAEKTASPLPPRETMPREPDLPPPAVVVQRGHIIPSDINLNQKQQHQNVSAEVNIIGEDGADFKVPFKRNMGHHIGNAFGQVGGCLVWIGAVIVIIIIIAIIAGIFSP